MNRWLWLAAAGALVATGLVVHFLATHHCAEYRDSTCQDCHCTLYSDGSTLGIGPVSASGDHVCIQQSCTEYPCRECTRWERDR